MPFLRTSETPSRSSAIVKGGLVNRWARSVVLAKLRRIVRGRLAVIDGGRHLTFGTASGTDADLTDVRLRVHDPRFYRAVALGGSLGAAEAHTRGWWDADDLTGLFRLFLRNLESSDRIERRWARLKGWSARLYHRLRDNTKAGSQRNIHAHYDLGNDFFALFLDPTLTYSCGVFDDPEMTLEDAAIAKLERACRKLALDSCHHVLEIGTGWGSFAIHAAKTRNCRVSTTTISREQYDLARERVRAEGLEDRVEVLLCDYRELRGQYDKLVSIEMIEAVGHRRLGTFFGKCGELLKPDGQMFLQAITMPDQRYEQYRRSVDFIQRYIFPGSCCPSFTALTSAVSRSSNLRVFHVEDIGIHYATTLRLWRENFERRADAVARLGYSAEFRRLWRYYLCYCEAGFAEGYLGDVQLVLTKPEARRSRPQPVSEERIPVAAQ